MKKNLLLKEIISILKSKFSIINKNKSDYCLIFIFIVF